MWGHCSTATAVCLPVWLECACSSVSPEIGEGTGGDGGGKSLIYVSTFPLAAAKTFFGKESKCIQVLLTVIFMSHTEHAQYSHRPSLQSTFCSLWRVPIPRVLFPINSVRAHYSVTLLSSGTALLRKRLPCSHLLPSTSLSPWFYILAVSLSVCTLPEANPLSLVCASAYAEWLREATW